MGNILCGVLPKKSLPRPEICPSASVPAKQAPAMPSVPAPSMAEGELRSPFDGGAVLLAAGLMPELPSLAPQPNAATGATLTTNCIIPSVPVGEAALNLQTCQQLLDSVQLISCIGSGSFALVYRGVYQGSDCAVKFMCSNALDRTGVREALVGPQLHHPQVLRTYVTRAAVLTREFLESFAEEGRGGIGSGPSDPSASGATTPGSSIPVMPSMGSEDGFGNPRKVSHARQGWREMLAAIGAGPHQTMVMAVQELCELGSLQAAIQRSAFRPKPGLRTEDLARRALLRTAAEISRGMIHLHAASVVHGDLKPANVLLAKSRMDRRGYTAKVADFGLSHVLGHRSKAESSTQGTVAYMCPESYTGTVSKAADVYAMGIILWEMLTGQRVYEGLSVAQIMMGVSLQDLAPEWPDAVWPDLCALGRRCMAPDPEQRPTFVELESQLVDLELVVRNEVKARRAAERLTLGQIELEPGTPVAVPAAAAAEAEVAAACPGGVHVAEMVPAAAAQAQAEAEAEPSFSTAVTMTVTAASALITDSAVQLTLEGSDAAAAADGRGAPGVMLAARRATPSTWVRAGLKP